MESEPFRQWHRLFGLILCDFFTGTPFQVELEKDLALKKQLLDVVVLRKGKGRFVGQLPDGLDGLVAHNLITFKSHQEALDDWALKELTGHYVNYRKQVSPQKGELLPEEDFRLYAVCSRYPHNLANLVPWETVQEGVYRCRRGTDVIRVMVANQLPRTERNAMLHLFSASEDQVNYGARNFKQRSDETSSLLDTLVQRYRGEGLKMPYTLADFRRDYILEHFHELTPEELSKALESLRIEQRLAGLSDEEIEQALQKRKARAASGPKKKRRKGE